MGQVWRTGFLSSVVTALLAFGAAGPAIADDAGDITELQDRIDALVTEHVGTTTPGAMVAVVDADGPVILEAWGQADPQEDIPLTLDSRTPVASVSKVVTALTALTMHHEGLLDLDADIRADLPVDDRRDVAVQTPVTGRHLLTHRSGITESMLFHPDPPSEYPTGSLLPALRDNPPQLRLPTDTGMHYSALQAYTLLGAAIEEANGTTFDDAAHQWVLSPVGAQDADFHGPSDAAGDVVIGTQQDDQWRPAGWPAMHERPAAALTWSTRDASALLQTLLTGQGLPDEVVSAALTPAVRSAHGSGGHTQVFFESSRADIPVLEHAGSNGVAWLALIPQANVGVFAAVTTEDADAAAFTDGVLDTVAGWAVDTGRAPTDPRPAEGLPQIAPPWAAEWEPATPVGTFQPRLFTGRGPELALRALTDLAVPGLIGQQRVTGSAAGLHIGDRVLLPAQTPGRWCDDQGCAAGLRTADDTMVLNLGEGMLEQNYVEASWWSDARFVGAALGVVLLLTGIAIIGAVRAGWRRRRDRAVAPAVSRPLALVWTLLAMILVIGTPAVVAGPLLGGSADWIPAHGPAIWALRVLTGVHLLVGAAWLIMAARRFGDLGTRRRIAMLPALAAGLAATLVLITWALPTA